MHRPSASGVSRIAIAVALFSFSSIPADAQTTCLPADSIALKSLMTLRALTFSPDDAAQIRTKLQLPQFTPSQAATEVVQVTSGSLCTAASEAFNSSIVSVDATDNDPTRPVYVFRVGSDRYAIRGLRHGNYSQVEIFDANWTYLAGYLP